MAGRSKVLEETVEAVKALAEDPAWTSRGFLPGLRDMARMAGCSHYTLWKAVKILEGRGLLEVRPGRRIRLPRPDGGRPEESLPGDSAAGVRYKWERLKRSMEMDILSGAFRPGETLPTLKELGVRYGASFLTLKKALRALEGGAVLQRGPGAYAVTPLRTRSRSTLIYFAWGNEAGQLKFYTPFDHEILGVLGNECARAGIRLEKVIYFPSGDKLHFLDGRKPQTTLPDICREAFGFLVRTACSRDVVPDLVPRLASLGKPVAVLDELGSPHFPRLHARYPNMAVFRHTISGTPARQMGAYLAGMGHRNIAFISPFHGTTWSQNRLVGLRECLQALGPGFLVHPFTFDKGYDLPWEDEKAEGPLETFYRGAAKARWGWSGEFPSLPGVLDRMRPELRAAMWREWVMRNMEPYLEQALKRKDITAWVAVDDDTAVLALEFLRRKGLRLPRDISLVGFDDTPEGARVDLTSYNFDFPRFFHGVVLRLLNPPSLSAALSRQSVDIEGRIVERGSSGRTGSGIPAGPGHPLRRGGAKNPAAPGAPKRRGA